MSFIDLKISEIPIDIGIITIWSGAESNIPNEWLWCNGDEKLKTDYPKLFDIIGDKYGALSNVDKFKLPDLNESVVIGKSTNTTIGEKIGSNLIQISANMLPQHNHNINVVDFSGAKNFTTLENNNHTHTMDNAGSHRHSFAYNTDESGNGTNAIVLTDYNQNNNNSGNTSGPMQLAGSHKHTIEGAGAHSHEGSVNINHNHTATADLWPPNVTQDFLNIMQSSVVMYYIIKAKTI